MTILLFIACLIVMLASLSGAVFFGTILSRWTTRNLKYLISFSAGIFVIIAYNLCTEAIETAPSISIVIIAMIAGVIGLHLASRLWPDFHHHHESDAGHSHSRLGAQRILISDSFHNIGDGVLLATTFIADIRLGIAATVGIFIHEVVQEISEFFVYMEAGYTKKEALVKNFLTSAAILVGALIGIVVGENAMIVGPLLAFAAGAFLYIIIVDFIPKSVHNIREERAYLKHIACAVIGIIVMYTVSSYVGHDNEKRDNSFTDTIATVRSS